MIGLIRLNLQTRSFLISLIIPKYWIAQKGERNNKSIPILLVLLVLFKGKDSFMRQVLNVAEKPSVAKEVSRILAGGSQRTMDSESKYNPVYQFDFKLQQQPVSMLFTRWFIPYSFTLLVKGLSWKTPERELIQT